MTTRLWGFSRASTGACDRQPTGPRRALDGSQQLPGQGQKASRAGHLGTQAGRRLVAPTGGLPSAHCSRDTNPSRLCGAEAGAENQRARDSSPLVRTQGCLIP